MLLSWAQHVSEPPSVLPLAFTTLLVYLAPWPFSFLPEYSLFWNLPTLLFQEGHFPFVLWLGGVLHVPHTWACLGLRKPSAPGVFD